MRITVRLTTLVLIELGFFLFVPISNQEASAAEVLKLKDIFELNGRIQK
jgi:hypothetical protein